MTKKILFLIGSLNAGGAERSLVSLLALLPQDKYQIDLMLIKQEGDFLKSVPDYINIVNAPLPFRYLGVSPKNLKIFLKYGIKWWFVKIFNHIGTLILVKKRKLSYSQALWTMWRRYIAPNEISYDVAVSYLEGVTNYYIIDCVNATHKFLWIHNEYNKLHYDSEFDSFYFAQSDSVVTISNTCKQDLEKYFPSLRDKIVKIENITNPGYVKSKAVESINEIEYPEDKNCLKILSVGRLVPQKSYDLAIQSACELKKMGISFHWLILGEGEERNVLQQMIDENGLNQYIQLVGVKKNPYPYIANCDVVVQTSIFEGKSIVIDEAKILCKPIVITNYVTATDAIINNINGIIVEREPYEVANAIVRVSKDDQLKNRLVAYLFENEENNLSEINKYMSLFDL